MSDLEVLEQTGTEAVKRLRKKELEAGNTFMINSKDLPAKQSYLEYPDGSINVVTVAPDSRSFVSLRKLSSAQAQAVRRRFNLL